MSVSVVALIRTPLETATAPELDPNQQSVVNHQDGPLLVLAGPGTGKTTTIVEAIVARLQGHAGQAPVKPDRILALTFGRRAAAELRDRVAARLGGGALPTVTTFHSFCYGVVQHFATTDDYLHPPRLITAPEQDRRVRELLLGSVRDGRLEWPTELEAAVGTRGLAAEVRTVIARARGLELDGRDLARLGRDANQPAWVAIGEFLGEYLDVLDAEGVLDYSELIHRASELIAGSGHESAFATNYDAVFVDEYQDTDPSQVRLLKHIVSPATCFVAVGDPDQAIYGFRGADVGGILRFGDNYRGVGDTQPSIAVLDSNRRYGSAIGGVASRIIRRVPLGALPREIQQRHREPEFLGSKGEVSVVIYESKAAQASSIADSIRRLKLTGSRDGADPLTWSDFAILVRSGVGDIPALQRALETSGVPVEVAGDEIPLRSQSAVQPHLDALRVAAHPEQLTAERAMSLLASPLGGMDGRALRRFGRDLRALQRNAGETPESSAELIRAAIADPSVLLELKAERVQGPQRIANMLNTARKEIEKGQSVEDVLWQVWSCTTWPTRLRKAALAGGTAGRNAHRDLDAVVALFDTAARTDAVFEGRRGVADFIAELDQQAIPGTTLAQTGGDRDAVRLMTAHRAKGLEWPVVIVAGVQEGQWPDLRRRGSLLRADELGPDGLEEPLTISALLAEERRLFYVACTRAKQRLVVTAVQAPDDQDLAPSRFVDEVVDAGSAKHHVAGLPLQRLTAPSIVAHLRHIAESPDASDATRSAAADRLARLAVDGGFAQADPDHWWGTRPISQSEKPIRDPDGPLKFSGTAWAAVADCSLRWFLSREARGERPKGMAMAFGSIVHALADAVGRRELPADPVELSRRLEDLWPAMPYEATWEASSEMAAANTAIERFLNWQAEDVIPGREVRNLVGTEVPFKIEIDVGDDSVLARGFADRLETDESGALHVIDLKTSKSKPTQEKVNEHHQLALYQMVAQAGGFDEQLGVEVTVENRDEPPAGSDRPPVAGAELVQLRNKAKLPGWPAVQQQDAIDVDEQLTRLAEAVEVVRSEEFKATHNQFCGFCDFKRMCPAYDVGREVTS